MPIVIFGVKSIVRDSGGGETTMGQCGKCNYVGSFQAATRWTFLSLFWIPVIPVWFTRATRCSNCGALFKRN